MRGNHKTNKLGTSCQHGTTYIVETRCHPNLPLVIKNVDQCLPKDWVIMIFCSKENELYANDIKKQVSGRKIIVKLLNDAITSLDDYNNLLFSTAFWQQFETENLLGFQVDSWLSIEQKELLAEIANYDYVGAPWSERIQRRWNYIPSYGGNGGVCFSKRSARLNALLYSEQERVTGEPFNQVLNEDIWFSHAIKNMGGKLPSRNQSIKWFVESVYSKQPFAVHKPWVYLTDKQFLLLCDKNKGLRELKTGCESPMIESDDYEKEAYRKFLLRFARVCSQENNFYQADLALQVCQQRSPSNPVAFNLHALLANKLGLHDQALSFVNQAIKLEPRFNKAIENKTLIENTLSRKAKPEIQDQQNQARYLLIHSWGSGLGLSLIHI